MQGFLAAVYAVIPRSRSWPDYAAYPRHSRAEPVSYTHLDVYKRQEHNVLGANADLVDSSSQDLAGCKGIGAAELTAGDQNSLISCLLYTSRCV